MFFERLDRFAHTPALKQGVQTLTYTELERRVTVLAEELPAPGNLIALACDNSIATVVSYLAALRHRNPLLLIDAKLPQEQQLALVNRYGPVGVLNDECFTPNGSVSSAAQCDARLAVMLSTSGSTGSPKYVCLSYANLQSNAESIVQYLPLQNTDTTITTLPFAYAYGLSVVNTHLLSGACVVLSDVPVTSREFWQEMEQQPVTCIAGVPTTYEMLLRLGLTRKSLPHLRYLTQAGGKLSAEKVKVLAEYAAANDKAFYVMYGQTEATARMSYLAPGKALLKPTSIGQAIPSGAFEIRDENGEVLEEPDIEGQLYYTGPNLMLGYAHCADDLASFSGLTALATGDLAKQDADGDYYITGRIARIVKPLGRRISLDDVETWLEKQGIVGKAMGDDDKLLVALVQETTQLDPVAMQNQLGQYLRLHPSFIRCMLIDEVPQTGSGKTDYPALRKLFDGDCL